MSLFKVTVTTTPVDVSEMFGVQDRGSVKGRGQNQGPEPIYRVVSTSVPTDLSGAVWRYTQGETFTFLAHATTNGTTYLMTASGEATAILENNVPG